MSDVAENRKTDLEASADSEGALLAKYGLSHLPEVFAMRERDGSIIQEREPCYRCVAEGFYGIGTSGTWYDEGSIVVLDSTPNQFTEPLNRSAAVRWTKWADRLPTSRVVIDIGDMAEAAQMLAKNPKVQGLDPSAYQAALIKLCEEIKIRRDGKDARSLPLMSPHNFAPQSGGNAAPLLGAKAAQVTDRGPGHLHEPGGGATKGARRAGNTAPTVHPLGGPPPSP